MPGYTKKETNQWLYSIKAVELIRNYMTQCPDLFERLAQNVTNDIFQEQELFKEYVVLFFFIQTNNSFTRLTHVTTQNLHKLSVVYEQFYEFESFFF